MNDGKIKRKKKKTGEEGEGRKEHIWAVLVDATGGAVGARV